MLVGIATRLRCIPVRGDCHCSGCLGATGSAFKAFAGIEWEKLTTRKGLEDIAVFGGALVRMRICDAGLSGRDIRQSCEWRTAWLRAPHGPYDRVHAKSPEIADFYCPRHSRVRL